MTGCPNNRLRLLWVSLAAVVLAACGHSSKPTAKPSPTTSASISTTTTVAPDAAVIAAWRHYWDIYIAVAGEMNLPDPRLADVATGEELRQLGSGFLAFKSEGEVFRGTIDLNPRVTTIDGTTATIKDCYLSHILGFDAATNQPKGSEDPTRRLVTVSMQLEGGAWKVAAIHHDGDGCTSS